MASSLQQNRGNSASFDIPWVQHHPSWLQRLRQILAELFIPASHRPRIRAARKHLRQFSVLAARSDTESRKKLYYQLRSMDPLEFEELVLECLFRLGNHIRRNRRYSGDGGLDGQVFLQGAWAPIQCKRYRDTIRPEHVADFARLLEKRRSRIGLFVHTGRTGQGSRDHASAASNQIIFVSGDRLCRLLAQDRPGVDKSSKSIG